MGPEDVRNKWQWSVCLSRYYSVYLCQKRKERTSSVAKVLLIYLNYSLCIHFANLSNF